MSTSTSDEKKSTDQPPPALNFPLTDVESHNKPLGEGRYVKTAGCLIIGDEVLNGKVREFPLELTQAIVLSSLPELIC